MTVCACDGRQRASARPEMTAAESPRNGSPGHSFARVLVSIDHYRSRCRHRLLNFNSERPSQTGLAHGDSPNDARLGTDRVADAARLPFVRVALWATAGRACAAQMGRRACACGLPACCAHRQAGAPEPVSRRTRHHVASFRLRPREPLGALPPRSADAPADAAVCAGEVCDLFLGCSVLFGIVEAADVLRVGVRRESGRNFHPASTTCRSTVPALLSIGANFVARRSVHLP